jgi:hypothetical protein
MRCLRLIWCASLILAASSTAGSLRAETLSAGPLFDEFKLTLAPGHRTEAAGPFYYRQEKESQLTFAVPPLFSQTRDPDVEAEEFDFVYPLLTYERYGEQYRWQLFQLLSFAGGPTQTETNRNRFTLFPVYFQQRSSDPSENYTAVFPFYGHLKNRLFRDDIFFVMFPGYGRTRKREVVTDNYLYPIFHLRHGPGLEGWQFWPLLGHEHKDVTTRTNRFNDVETVAGHDKRFVLWPFYLNQYTGIGAENPAHEMAVIPFYSQLRSKQRDSTTVFWPFFSHVDDREKKYKEWDLPWPLVEFAHGEGKTLSRVWPFYSVGHSPTMERDFYLWPIYKSYHIHDAPLDRRRMRIAFFLYSDTRDKNTETQETARRVDCWPLFTRRHEFNGNDRLQVLAVLEPFLAGSHKIERDYSPLWSVWRAEHNPRTRAASQSLLWNLYRHETAPEHRKVSVFFGLYQRQTGPDGSRTRLFYIPLGKRPAREAKFEDLPTQ